MAYLDDLREYVCNSLNCNATHVESVPIFEQYDPNHFWKGTVEVFSLQGYSEASKCYAWSLAEGKNVRDERFIIVRHIPPNDSPLKAVRAVLDRDIRVELEAVAKLHLGDGVTLGPIEKTTMGDSDNEGVQRLRRLFNIQDTPKEEDPK